ncbi:hypothetical protein [Gimesia maris]|uniref:hypothetical protein n=1 Tax=Gimesia maris TaxID=122 RepID=UPI0032F079D5
MIVQEDITQHAAEANRWQEKCQEHQREAASHQLKALTCAMRSGEELIQIKDKLPHGEYEIWVKNEFKGGLSTARRNKSLAENWNWITIKVDAGEICTIDDAKEQIKQRNKQKREKYEDHESLEKVRLDLFIQQLEAASLGLSSSGYVEQTDMFVFKDGRIITYNDGIACSIDCGLPIEGVVAGRPLLNILKKLDETYIKIEVDDSLLVIKGRRNESGIRLEQEIRLPVEDIPTPQQWESLSEDFQEAVETVAPCAGSDETQPKSVYIHITKRYIQASDNFQICRYWIQTGIEKNMLIRATELENTVKHEMTEFSITPEWIHFQNDQGVMISCRYYTEGDTEIGNLYEADDSILYPSLDFIIETPYGEPLTLPTGLASAVSRAELFTKSNGDSDKIRFDLMGNTLKVLGEGVNGHYQEELDLEDTAPQISFCMSPKLILQFAKKYKSCEVSKKILKVDAGAFVYMAYLSEALDD